MAFKVFKRQMAPLAKEPFVTIQRRGTIGLNPASWAALGNSKAVELLFDEETREVAFRVCDLREEHSYQIRPLGKSGAGLISAVAFCDYLGVDREVARRWPATMQDNMLVIDLKAPATEIHSKRGASATASASAPSAPVAAGAAGVGVVAEDLTEILAGGRQPEAAGHAGEFR